MKSHEQISNGSNVCHNGFSYRHVLLLRSNDDKGDGAEQTVAITDDASEFYRLSHADFRTTRCEAI